MDVGCYPVRLMRAHTGEEPVVAGAAAHTFAPDVDGDMTVDLAFPGGITGRASCSMWTEGGERVQYAVITGDRGSLRVTNPFQPQHGNELVITVDGEQRSESVTTEPSYTYQLAAFRDAVVQGTPVLTGPGDSVATMRVIDAAYEVSGLGVRQPTTIDA